MPSIDFKFAIGDTVTITGRNDIPSGTQVEVIAFNQKKGGDIEYTAQYVDENGLFEKAFFTEDELTAATATEKAAPAEPEAE